MKKLLIALLLLSWLIPAMAGRMLPPNAKRGELTGAQYPMVSIDDTVYRLSPGARIFSATNQMILPNLLPQSGAVFYQLDAYGNLTQLWLATDQEKPRGEVTPPTEY